MKIEVIYFDDRSPGMVDVDCLEELIRSWAILGFRRYSGWVKLGRDPVRGGGGEYVGPERRTP
jgi:hypothetical protein